jgi:hypothetical protein
LTPSQRAARDAFEAQRREKPYPPLKPGEWVSWGTGRRKVQKPALGSNLVALSNPTLEQFVTHGKKFGTECVYETAQAYLAEPELRQLDAELSRVNAKRPRVFGDDAKAEVDGLILELGETLPTSEVSRRTGKPAGYVRKVLAGTV